MRGTYHDKVAHKFIEGQIQSKPVESSLREETAEKAAYHADLTQGYELEDDTNGIDVSYHDENERFDLDTPDNNSDLYLTTPLEV